MKTKRKNERSEMLSRNIEISSFATSVRLHASERRGEDPVIESRPWLELRGTMAEPIRDVRDVMISLFPREDATNVGTARPASVGALIQVRPELSFVITWPPADFDRVWALALSGRLTHARLSFTKPYRGSALVVGASFSNEAEE